MSDSLSHLGSIWYHLEPSDVPFSQNQFLGGDFFAIYYSKTALRAYCPYIYTVISSLTWGLEI